MRDVLDGLMEAACAAAYSPYRGASHLTILSIEPPRNPLPETRARVVSVATHRSSNVLSYLLRREQQLASADGNSFPCPKKGLAVDLFRYP